MAMDFEKELKLKPYLTQARKIGGRVVQEELVAPTFDEEEALEGLLQGVEADEVEEGRERLLRENPSLASTQIHEILDIQASASQASEFTNPVREAGVKRAGKLALRETGETFNFRRIEGGRRVELASDEGQVFETLSNLEFDAILGSGDYIVL